MNGSVGQYPFGIGIFGGGFAVTSFPATLSSYVGSQLEFPISVKQVTGELTFRLYRNGFLVHSETFPCELPFTQSYSHEVTITKYDNNSSWHYEITNQYVTIISDPCIVSAQFLELEIDTVQLLLTNPDIIIESLVTDIIIRSIILSLRMSTPVVEFNPQIEVVLSADLDTVINMGTVTYTANVVQNFGTIDIIPEQFQWAIRDKYDSIIYSGITIENKLSFKFMNSDSYKYIDGDRYRVDVVAKLLIPDDDILVLNSVNTISTIFNEIRAMIRARENRIIDIEQFLPEQYHDTDVHDLIKAYQYTLNNMYNDNSGVMKLVIDELDKSTEWDINLGGETANPPLEIEWVVGGGSELEYHATIRHNSVVIETQINTTGVFVYSKPMITVADAGVYEITVTNGSMVVSGSAQVYITN